MLRSMLPLKDAVTVNRITEESDGMGGVTSTTVSTILSYAAIWQNSSLKAYMFDRLTVKSSHTLACETNGYTWNGNDRTVTYAGTTYTVAGKPDDVMQQGELTLVPIEVVA